VEKTIIKQKKEEENNENKIMTPSRIMDSGLQLKVWKSTIPLMIAHQIFS